MIFFKHPCGAVVVKRNPGSALGIVEQEFFPTLIFLSKRPCGQGRAGLVGLKGPYGVLSGFALRLGKGLIVTSQLLVSTKGFVDFKRIGP